MRFCDNSQKSEQSRRRVPSGLFANAPDQTWQFMLTGSKYKDPVFRRILYSEPQVIVHQDDMNASCVAGEAGNQELAADRVR